MKIQLQKITARLNKTKKIPIIKYLFSGLPDEIVQQNDAENIKQF